MLDEIKKIQKQSEIDLKSCDTELKIDAWRVKYLGRKSRLSLILKDIKNLDPAMRKSVGLSGNRIRNKCQIMLEKALNDL